MAQLTAVAVELVAAGVSAGVRAAPRASVEYGQARPEEKKRLEPERRAEIADQAEQGNSNAQYRLGISARDEAEKWKWACLAANQDHAYAQSLVGGFYRYGDASVERDQFKAYMWYSFAASNGDPRAAGFLDDLSAGMRPKDIAVAKRLATEWRPDPALCDLNLLTPDHVEWPQDQVPISITGSAPRESGPFLPIGPVATPRFATAADQVGWASLLRIPPAPVQPHLRSQAETARFATEPGQAT